VRAFGEYLVENCEVVLMLIITTGLVSPLVCLGASVFVVAVGSVLR